VVGSGPPLMAGAAHPPAAIVENPPAAGASGRIDGACRRGTPGVSGAARYKTNACEHFFLRQAPKFSLDFAHITQYRWVSRTLIWKVQNQLGLNNR
jgi:hypothetical protein